MYFLPSMVSHRVEGVPSKLPDKKNSFNVLRKEKQPKFTKNPFLDDNENFTPTETPLFITSMVTHTTSYYNDNHKSKQIENQFSKAQSSIPLPDKKDNSKKNSAIQATIIQTQNNVEISDEKLEKKEKKTSFLQGVKNFFTRKKEPKVKGDQNSSSKNSSEYDKKNKENVQTLKMVQSNSENINDHVFTQCDTSNKECGEIIYDCMNDRLRGSLPAKEVEESNNDFSLDSSGIKHTPSIKYTEDCDEEGLEYFFLKSGLNNLVLEAGLGDQVPTLRTKRGTQNQLWTFCGNNLKCKNGLVLEIKAGMYGNEAEVVTNTPTNDESQMFYMDKNCIVCTRDETVLDIYYGMTSEKNFVWMFSRNGSPAQTWTCVMEKEEEDNKCAQDLRTKEEDSNKTESLPDSPNSRRKKKRNRNRTLDGDEDTTPCDPRLETTKVKEDIKDQKYDDDVKSLQRQDERNTNKKSEQIISKNKSDASNKTSNKKRDMTLKNQGSLDNENSKSSLNKQDSSNSSGEKPIIIVAEPRGIPRPRRKNLNDTHDSETFSSSIDSGTEKQIEGIKRSTLSESKIESEIYMENQIEGIKESSIHGCVLDSENISDKQWLMGQHIKNNKKSSKNDHSLEADKCTKAMETSNRHGLVIEPDTCIEKEKELIEKSDRHITEAEPERLMEKMVKSRKNLNKSGLVKESESYIEKQTECANMPESNRSKEKDFESTKKEQGHYSMEESESKKYKGKAGNKKVKDDNKKSKGHASEVNSDTIKKLGESDFVSKSDVSTDKNITDIKTANRHGSVTESDKYKVKQIEDIKRSSRHGSLTGTDNSPKPSPKEIKKASRQGYMAESDNSCESTPKQRKKKSRPSSFVIDSEEFNQAVDSFDKLEFENTPSIASHNNDDKTDVMAINSSPGFSNDAMKRMKKSSGEEFNRAVNDSFDRLEFSYLEDSSTEETGGSRRSDKKEDLGDNTTSRKEKLGGLKPSKSFVESEEFNKAVDSFDELFLAENIVQKDENVTENDQTVHKTGVNEETPKNNNDNDIVPQYIPGESGFRKKKADNITSKNITRLQRECEGSTTDSTESEGEINRIVSEGHSYVNYQDHDLSRFQRNVQIEPSKKGGDKVKEQHTLSDDSDRYGKEGTIQMEFDMSAIEGSEKSKSDGHKGMERTHGPREITELNPKSNTSNIKVEKINQSEKRSRSKEDSLHENFNIPPKIQPPLISSESLDQSQHSSYRHREVEKMNKKNKEKSSIKNKNIKKQRNSSELLVDTEIYKELEGGESKSRSIETNKSVQEFSRRDETFLNEEKGIKKSIECVMPDKDFSLIDHKNISIDNSERIGQPTENIFFDKEQIKKSYVPTEIVSSNKDFSSTDESLNPYRESAFVGGKDETRTSFEKNIYRNEFTGINQGSTSYEENIDIDSERKLFNASLDDEDNDNVVLKHSLIIDGNRIKNESQTLRFPSAGQSLSNEQDFNVDKDYFETLNRKNESDQLIKGIVQKHSLTIGGDEIVETKCTYLPTEMSDEIIEPLKLLTGDEKITETKVLYNTDKDGEMRKVVQSHALEIEDNKLIETKHSFVGQTSLDSGNTYANKVKSGIDSRKSFSNPVDSNANVAKLRPNTVASNPNAAKSSSNTGDSTANNIKSGSNTRNSKPNTTKSSRSTVDSNFDGIKSISNTGDDLLNTVKLNINTGDSYANLTKSSFQTGDSYSNVAKPSFQTGDSYANVTKSSFQTEDSYSNVAKSSVANSSSNTGDSYGSLSKSNDAKSSFHTVDFPQKVAKSGANPRNANVSMSDVAKSSSSNTGDTNANVAMSHIAKSSVHTADSHSNVSKSGFDSGGTYANIVKMGLVSGDANSNVVKSDFDSKNAYVDPEDSHKSETIIVCDDNSTIDPEKLKNVDGQAHQRSGFSKFQRRKSNKDKHKSPSRRESEILKDQDYGATPTDENVNLSTKLEETNVQMRRLEETFTSMCEGIIRPSNSTTGIDAPIVKYRWTNQLGSGADLEQSLGDANAGHRQEETITVDNRLNLQNFESSVNVRPTIPVYRPVAYGNQSQKQQESETSTQETIPPESEDSVVYNAIVLQNFQKTYNKD